MPKFLIHVHRLNSPDKCFWACRCPLPGHPDVLGLHPDIGMADEFEEHEIQPAAVQLAHQFQEPMDLSPEAMTGADIPRAIKELVKL